MTHYEEFGVDRGATPDQIRQAHRNLARLIHPDHIQDEALRPLAECQMKRLNSIYAVLMDPARRRMYDLQQGAPSPDAVVAAPAETVVVWKQRARDWGALCLSILTVALAGAAWLGSQPRERVVYVEKPAAGAPVANPGRAARSESSARSDEVRELAEETRELRRLLNQVILERDQAVSRLAGPRTSPAIPAAAAVAAAAAAAPTRAPATEPPRLPAPEAPPLSASTPARAAARPRWSGTWIYSAPGARTSPEDQYPAEYIELVIGERDDNLFGRYRGRYRVPDRALPPEVEFYFEGPAGNPQWLKWRGNNGARGELQLKLHSENTLSIDWFTSQLGKSLMLGSGTALLVRRQEGAPQ